MCKCNKPYMHTSMLTLLVLFLMSCVPIVTKSPIPEFTSTEYVTTTSSTLPLSHTITPAITTSKTSFMTWTPLPTLSDIASEVQLLAWLEGSVDCRFPCWAGITPGVTSWQEAKQTLGAVLDFRVISENTTCTFGPCNTIEWRSKPNLEFHGYFTSAADNNINWIIIDGYPSTPVIRPDRILTQYGPPDKVFLDTGCYTMEPYDAYFALILGYSEHHFFIKYHMRGILSGDNINGYLIPGEYVYLSIKMIDGEWTEEIIKKALHGDEEIPAWLFRSLEDATDMTVDDLYEKFKDIDGSEYIVAHCRDESP